MKKKISTLALMCIIFAVSVQAQTQKNWYLIGGNISNFSLDFQKGSTNFSATISPKVAWFVKDNLAVGGQVGLSASTSKNVKGFGFDVGPLLRYYAKGAAISDLQKARWFGEANIGFTGNHTKVTGLPANNLYGWGFGIGPGFAYFINQNIAVEGLLKYKHSIGFNNSNIQNGIELGVGVQVYLPKAKIKELKAEIK